MLFHDECMIDLSLNIQQNDSVLFVVHHATGDGLFNVLTHDPKVVYAVTSNKETWNELQSVIESKTIEELWNKHRFVANPLGSWMKLFRFFYCKSTLKLQKDAWSRYEYITKCILWCLSRPFIVTRFGMNDRQIQLITHHDRRSLYDYMWTVVNGIFQNIHIHENFYYYSLFYGEFTKDLCPLILKSEYFQMIQSKMHVIEQSQDLNTTLSNVKSLNKVVLLDQLDRMRRNEVLAVIAFLKKCMQPHSTGLLKSVSVRPWFIDEFSRQGFDINQNASHQTDKVIDFVNIHASFWTFKPIKDCKTD